MHQLILPGPNNMSNNKMMHSMTPHVITSVMILCHRGPDETDIQHWQEHNTNIMYLQ